MGKHIIVKNVRCSFPSLYKTEIKDGQEFKPGITILLKKSTDGEALAEIQKAIKSAIADNDKLKKQPPQGDKLCLKGPASESWRDQYEGYDLILKAGSQKPIVALHKNATEMTEAENLIYSGCYVNVKIEIWGQANQYGRRVNAKALAVQFVADGESFDGSYVSKETAAEGFGSLEDEPFGGADVEQDTGSSDSVLD